MEENMTEKEQATALIEEYAKLQRIKTAEDRDSELEYQIKITNKKSGSPPPATAQGTYEPKATGACPSAASILPQARQKIKYKMGDAN